MENLLICPIKTTRGLKILLITLVIALSSIPAIAMIAGEYVEILDCCSACGACVAASPDAFVLVDGKAQVISGYTHEQIEAGQKACPHEAILTSW